MLILTVEMIRKAVELVRPSANKILKTKGTTWGPRWVMGYIALRDRKATVIPFTFGTFSEDWREEWGKYKNFNEIALAKLEVVLREGMSTRLVVATQPWSLRPGEYLYPGGVIRGNICVAVSGANGSTDEAIAEMVLSAIIMLAQLETSERIKAEENKI
jgi:hypothetical protein